LGGFELLRLIGDVLAVGVEELTLVVFNEEVQGAGSVATTLGARVGGDPHNSDAVKLAESVILELLGDGPRD